MRAIHLGEPVNRAHPANRDLAFWWYGLQGFTACARDICRVEIPHFNSSANATLIAGDRTDGYLTGNAKFVPSIHGDYAVQILDSGGGGKVVFGQNQNQMPANRSAFGFTVQISVFPYNTQASSPNIRDILGTDNNSGNVQYFLRLGNSGTPTIVQWVSNSVVISSSIALPVQKWTRITFIYDGTIAGSGYRMLFDNCIVASGTSGGLLGGGNATAITLGSQAAGGRYWNGLLKNFKIFGRGITTAEVEQDVEGEKLQYTNGVLNYLEPAEWLDFAVSSGSVIDKSTSNTLTLSQTATETVRHDRSADSTLTLSDSVAVLTVGNDTADDTLTLTQTATATKLGGGSVSQSLTLTQSVDVSTTLNLDVDSSVSLTDHAAFSIDVSASDTLTLSQTVTTIVGQITDNSLSLSDTATVTHSFARSLSQRLTVTQAVAVNKSISLSARSVWSASVTAKGKKHLNTDASDTLSLDQDLVRDRFLKSVSHLTSLDHEVSKQRVRLPSVEHTLDLGQSVSVSHTAQLSVSDELVFKEVHDRQTGIPSFPTINIPSAFITKVEPTTVLQAPNVTIVLPPAEFADSQANSGRVNIKRAMNGHRRVYRRQLGITQKLRYRFVVDRRKAIELRAFVRVANTVPITLTNWKGEVWKVVLSTNPVVLSEDGFWGLQAGGNKSSVTLEFEGARIN